MLNKFRQTLYDWRRKRFGRYIIQNPQPIAAAAPYTYYLPPTEFLEALAVGDIVKLIFESIPISYEYGAERMYPDSGWRIRGDVSLMTDAQCENESADYIALGAVLNADDSWLHLIDSPVGSQFFKNPETDEFEIDTSELT